MLKSAATTNRHLLCVFARCPSKVPALHCILTIVTMVINARNVRLSRLIFVLVLAIQTAKDVATDMSVIDTRVYNVGHCSIGGATCGITSRRSIITGDVRVRSVRSRLPRKMD